MIILAHKPWFSFQVLLILPNDFVLKLQNVQVNENRSKMSVHAEGMSLVVRFGKFCFNSSVIVDSLGMIEPYNAMCQEAMSQL